MVSIFCLHFLYFLQRNHKRGTYLFPRGLFRQGLDLSFSFRYLNVMHTHTDLRSLSSGFQVQFTEIVIL